MSREITAFVPAVVIASFWVVEVAMAECVSHARAGSSDSTQYVDSSYVTVTWNHSIVCPMFPQPKLACCSQAQYSLLRGQLMVMERTFRNCPACNWALRAMWCEFTCGIHQSDFNEVLEKAADGRLIDLRMNVSQSLADRLWQSCRNAVMGAFIVKMLFPAGVSGLLATFAEHSPYTDPNRYLIREIVIDKEAGHKPMNTSSVEERYACSQASHVDAVDYYALPKATVGGMPLNYFVGIVLGLLLFAITIVATINRRTTQKDEDG